jgi:phasin family protein
MISSPEQYTAANKAFFESQLASFRELANIALHGTEKIVTLNIAAAKASAEETTAAVKDLLAAKDPEAFIALATQYAKPDVDKIAAYNQHLTTIASDTKAEVTKVIEEQTADVRAKVTEFIDTIAKNSPVGAESVIALLKTSVENTNASLEKIHSVSKQVAETVEINTEKTAEQVTEGAKKATSKQ